MFSTRSWPGGVDPILIDIFSEGGRDRKREIMIGLVDWFHFRTESRNRSYNKAERWFLTDHAHRP